MDADTIREGLTSLPVIRRFMPRSEYDSLYEGMNGEEKEHFFNIVIELADRINNMPVRMSKTGKEMKQQRIFIISKVLSIGT